MPLFAELTIRAYETKTRIDINVDAIVDGLHVDVWQRTTIADITAYQSVTETDHWLCVALRRVLEVLDHEPAVMPGDVDHPAAAEQPQPAGEGGEYQYPWPYKQDGPTGPIPIPPGEQLT